MLLKKILIKGFRSVRNEVSLPVRQDMTCLIGANEHGKSNILHSLNLLNGGTFEEFDHHTSATDSSEATLSFVFELDSKEKKSLLETLQNEIQLHETQESDETKRKQVVSLFEKSITNVASSDAPEISITLQADNNRWLVIYGPRYRFNLSQSTGRPLQEWFKKHVPQVRLFEAGADLVDSISLAELRNRTNLPFEGLLKLAGVWDDVETLFEGANKAHRLQSAAERKLTKRVRQIWSQGTEHTFELNETGQRLHIAIKDKNTYDTPSRRSLGFKSFFSFYLTLYAETEEIDPTGFILLFDEPGIHLHPQGQKDLLREIRKLSQQNQIIYTTHSPFLVDRNYPAATVLIRKGTTGDNRGTHVVAKPYGNNWAPLNSALGITPADGFFPADRVLLVEGRSDRLYLTAHMVAHRNKTKADLNFLSIMDCERRHEIPDYVRMLTSADREIVVLADADQGGDNLREQIRRIAGKGKQNQVTFLDLRELLAVQRSVAIEDALPIDAWLDAVQEYVSLVLESEHQIEGQKIQESSGQQICIATAEYLTRNQVLQSSKKFSKVTVADIFCRKHSLAIAANASMESICTVITKVLRLAE